MKCDIIDTSGCRCQGSYELLTVIEHPPLKPYWLYRCLSCSVVIAEPHDIAKEMKMRELKELEEQRKENKKSAGEVAARILALKKEIQNEV